MTLVHNDRGTRILTGVVPALYDRIDVVYPDSVTIIYTFSLSGTVIGVVTQVNDSSGNLLSVERTS